MAKILIADDSRVHVHLLATSLKDRGYEVLVAQDGMQAGMLALRHAPDAIVLDINMPGGSGIEVLKRLRHSIKTKDIPVIVASGSCGLDVQQVALQLGVVQCLSKPVDIDQLCSILDHVLTPTPKRS
jgi:CheY-like chemotaxis protein